jgi:cytochrome b subunit of formate dehydrogenase
MDFVTWGASPWDQQVLIRISWDLLWASALAGVLFLVAHGSYMLFSPHRKGDPAETDRLLARSPGVPERIERHSLAARLFHWVMAASMFVLLFTAFLPVIGIRFAWVTIHWIAGVVLTVSVVYHIVHSMVWLDFWSIWVSPRDIPEAKAEILRELGHDVPGVPKPGKYPLGNRLYHLIITIAGFAVIGTGLVMMVRIRTPFLTRNPYLFGDGTWGWVYVLHGLAGVGLVGLVMAHVYFAVRPEKLWITKSMILGWITRRQYFEHHNPDRWVVSGAAAKGGAGRRDATA